jgi:protein-S-isoprenylcysteine O-methyltransferase Ste14
MSMNSQSNEDHPNIIAKPPLIFSGCALVSWLVQQVLPLQVMGYSLSLPIGIAVTLAAGALVLWAVFAMKASGTNVSPHRPALKIVRSGPYRFTRNPMYLALCLLQLGLGFILNGWIVLLFTIPLALILHFGVILREEKYLESKFGEQYVTLKRAVRRWI